MSDDAVRNAIQREYTSLLYDFKRDSEQRTKAIGKAMALKAQLEITNEKLKELEAFALQQGWTLKGLK